MRCALLCLLVFGIGVPRLFGQQPGEPSADEVAIRKAAASYVEAFNKHDAEAMSNQWSPDAVYLNRSTGEEVVERAAIAEQFTALFKDQPELKLEVRVESVEFV